jgi:rhomboid protease GluP
MDLIDQLLRLFGTNKVRMRWKLASWRDAMKRRVRSAGNRSKSLAYEHQLCPSCGHPASKDDKECSRCGARLYGATFNRAGRALGWLMPEGFPVATATILAACIGLYFVTVKATYNVLGDDSGGGFSPISLVLVKYGAQVPLLEVKYDQWWRGVTAIFLHGSVMHIAMNGFGLWVIGRVVEERFGRARMMVAFLLTGMAGSMASIWWNWTHDTPVIVGVGASGGLMGLMGLLVGHAVRFKGRTAREIRAQIVPWIIYTLIIGFATTGVDNAAHLGGLTSGAVFGAVLADRDQSKRLPNAVWNGAVVAAIGVIVFCFVQAARTPLP